MPPARSPTHQLRITAGWTASPTRPTTAQTRARRHVHRTVAPLAPTVSITISQLSWPAVLDATGYLVYGSTIRTSHRAAGSFGPVQAGVLRSQATRSILLHRSYGYWPHAVGQFQSGREVHIYSRAGYAPLKEHASGCTVIKTGEANLTKIIGGMFGLQVTPDSNASSPPLFGEPKHLPGQSAIRNLAFSTTVSPPASLVSVLLVPYNTGGSQRQCSKCKIL